MISRYSKSSIRILKLYSLFMASSFILNLSSNWLTMEILQSPPLTQIITTLLAPLNDELNQFLKTGIFLLVPWAIGTACGLLSRYALERYWIFPASKSERIELRPGIIKGFIKYAGTGAMTTLPPVCLMLLSWRFFGTDKSCYYTAITAGLIIGAVLKYRLDKHFVFRDQNKCGSYSTPENTVSSEPIYHPN